MLPTLLPTLRKTALVKFGHAVVGNELRLHRMIGLHDVLRFSTFAERMLIFWNGRQLVCNVYLNIVSSIKHSCIIIRLQSHDLIGVR